MNSIYEVHCATSFLAGVTSCLEDHNLYTS